MKNLFVAICLFFALSVSAQNADGFKLDKELLHKVVETNTSKADEMNRQVLKGFIERLFSAYETKDIDFIQKIFGDDALIFVKGNLESVASLDVKTKLDETVIRYSHQAKKNYVSMLKKVFGINASLKVNLDNVKVEVHSKKSYIYGLTLKYGWSSGLYSDEGYLFLLWDFINPDAPQIHVRTWQPAEYEVGKPIDEDEIFSIDDFEV